MTQEQITKLEQSIQNMKDKKSRIYLLVQDTKGNAKASVAYIYELGMALLKNGYNPIILHETPDYTGVEEWLGEDGMITNISYSNRGASYLGDRLQAGGTITAFDTETGNVTIDVYIKNDAAQIVAPGVIKARWYPTGDSTR